MVVFGFDFCCWITAEEDYKTSGWIRWIRSSLTFVPSIDGRKSAFVVKRLMLCYKLSIKVVNCEVLPFSDS